MSIFRQYTFDDSFLRVYVTSKLLKEYQLALTFARDYDEDGEPTNGVFHVYWDHSKVTPSAISQFRKDHPDVALKVFIVIGDGDAHYPFHPLDTDTWVSNATESLTAIIRDSSCDLNVAGIDVFYQNIDAEPDDFVQCVGQLIKNLKEANVISVASISPSASVNSHYYGGLYKTFGKYIEWVDYQFQNEESFVATPEKLDQLYNDLIKEFYPRKKLFAGYSAENQDWGKLSPILFFLVGSDLLKKRRAPGFSILYHDYGDTTASSSSSSSSLSISRASLV